MKNFVAIEAATANPVAMIYTTLALLSLNGAAALSSAALPCSVRPRAASSIRMGIGSEEMCA